MRKRKEDQQKFQSNSKSSDDHLHHPHYRHTKSTDSSRDSKNHFETQRINRKTSSIKVLSSYNRFLDRTIHKIS